MIHRAKLILMGAALALPVGIAIGAGLGGITDCKTQYLPWPETAVDTVAIILSPEEYRDTLVVREVRKMNAAAEQELVSEQLMLAVARVENRAAIPTALSRAGAVGLMQVMPSVWQGVFPRCGVDLYDPETNVCYGVHIFVYHLLRCEHDTLCALADYNGAVTPSKRTLYHRQVARALEGL